MNKALVTLQRVNEWIAVAAGLLLLSSVLVTVFDVAARPFGLSLGGTDELSGYAMAIATSWGMSYGLTHLAHVRIDLLRTRCNAIGSGNLRPGCHHVAFGHSTGHCLSSLARTLQIHPEPVESQHHTGNTLVDSSVAVDGRMGMVCPVGSHSSPLCVLSMMLRGRFSDVNDVAGLREET